MESRRKPAVLSTEGYRALVRSESVLAPSPWALDRIRYVANEGSRRLELFFPGPAAFSLSIPVDSIEELARATARDLRGLHLSPGRDTIVSDSLDVHLSVEGLIQDLRRSAVFDRIVSTLWGARGGRSMSDRKRAASAANGMKGGRPRKKILLDGLREG